MSRNIIMHWTAICLQATISGACTVEGVYNWGSSLSSVYWLLAAFNMFWVYLIARQLSRMYEITTTST